MKNLPASILSATELFTTANRIVDVSKSSLGDNPYVVKLCAFIEQGNSDLQKALGRTFTSEFTMLLYNMDDARDHAFIGFREFADAFTHSAIPEKKVAANTLAAIFENVGNTIHLLGYAVETTKIKTLITNLSTPVAQVAIGTIGATEWLEQLITSQEEFESVYMGKVEAIPIVNVPLIKDSRAFIAKYLGSLLNYIGTNSDFDNANYDPVKARINEIVTEAVAIARARNTRKENKDKEKDKAAL